MTHPVHSGRGQGIRSQPSNRGIQPTTRSLKRNAWLIGLPTAILAAGSVYAIVVGPTGPGPFYTYFDASGTVIGYRAIDCHGNKTGWGRTSGSYSDGVMICDPIWSFGRLLPLRTSFHLTRGANPCPVSNSFPSSP